MSPSIEKSQNKYQNPILNTIITSTFFTIVNLFIFKLNIYGQLLVYLFIIFAIFTLYNREPEENKRVVHYYAITFLPLIVLAVFYFAYPAAVISDQSTGTSPQIIDPPITSITSTVDTTGVCYYDWKGTPANNLSVNALPNNTYYMVTLYVKNDASQPVSTNAWYWKLVVDGVHYSRDIETFSTSIYKPPVELEKGGEIETQIVYRLNGIPSHAEIVYDRKAKATPKMERIKHYEL